MKWEFTRRQIKQQREKLSVSFDGVLVEPRKHEKIKAVLFFEAGKENRIYPLFMQQIKQHENKVILSCQEEVLLPYVFLNEINTDCTITLQILSGRQTVLCESAVEDVVKKELFNKGKKKKKSNLKIIAVIRSLAALCLLPVFLLEGMLGLIGIVPLQPRESRAKGLKALLKHVNARFYVVSGISFSKRENKSKYFARQYEKEKKQPVQTNQILFLSERKPNETGNLSLVKRELSKNPKYHIIQYQNEKTVSELSKQELAKIATMIAQSGIVILDDFYPQIHYLDRRDETKIIQLWHACGAFKTFGFSRLGKVGGPRQELKNHRSYDYCFVSSKYLINDYSEGFAIPTSHVLPLGVPRTDLFFDEAYKKKTREYLYKKYEVLKGKRIILFAPTFRGDGNRDAYYPTEMLNTKELSKQLPKDTIVIIKHHPFVKQKIEVMDNVIELEKEESINDVLLLTDILVTDYSSVIFEAAILDIPMIFYSFDQDSYIKERDFYYEYESFVPGKIVRTQRELEKALANPAVDKEKRNDFREYFMGAIDGRSTKRICSFIESL